MRASSRFNALATAALLSITCNVNAAYLERDLTPPGFFPYGQRGLGVDQNGSIATDFGQLQLDSDNGIDGAWSGIGNAGAGTIAGMTNVLGQQFLSIFATDASQDTYLFDATARLIASGEYYTDGVGVTIGNDTFAGPAYADVWVNQYFRILPGPGEAVGQPVLVTITADLFVNYGNDDARLIQDAFLDGMVLYHNATPIYTQPHAFHANQTLYDHTFVGQIGDVIGVQGATVFAHLSVPGAVFNNGEYWEAFIQAGLYGSVGVAPIPEPETWALLLAGLGLVALRLHPSIRRDKMTAAG